MLTYGYRSLYEGGSLLRLIYWVIGNGSWLYYVKAIFTPVIAKILTVLLVKIGIWIANKLPFGDKLKMLVGLW